MGRYPAIEPFAEGMLDVGDGKTQLEGFRTHGELSSCDDLVAALQFDVDVRRLLDRKRPLHAHAARSQVG